MKFYYNDLELDVPESIYEPAEDSLLVAQELEKLGVSGKRILEIGCGSGLLSIIAAKKGADVTAVDINPCAVEVTKRNAESNGVSLAAFGSDLFKKVKGKFDLIIFNPPYLPEKDGDVRWSGGADGRVTISRFARQAKRFLKPGGSILMVISSLTGEKEVMWLFEKEGINVAVIGLEKVPWEELILIASARRRP